MDIKQLEYFLILAEQQHMSAAAGRLGISQPALSKSIANLERELGVQLFDRHGNYIKLNDFGRNYAAYARKALYDLQSGMLSLRKSQYDICGEVRICCHAFADTLTDCINAYTELNPKVKIIIGQAREKDSELVERYDFLLEPQLPTSKAQTSEKNWFSLPLFRENFYILISPRYQIYPEEVTELSIGKLENHLFIDMEDITYFYTDITYRLCNGYGFRPKIFCSTEDFITKMQFVDAGKAICILPKCCLRVAKKLSPDVRVFNIKDIDTSRTLCLKRQKKSLMTETARDFWDFVQDYYGVGDQNTW